MFYLRAFRAKRLKSDTAKSRPKSIADTKIATDLLMSLMTTNVTATDELIIVALFL